jgi:hypothetical protein
VGSICESFRRVSRRVTPHADQDFLVPTLDLILGSGVDGLESIAHAQVTPGDDVFGSANR